MVDVFALTFVYPKLPITQKPAVIGWILITAIWTTVLLAVIWCRQRWGNYILSSSLLIAVITTLAGIPALPDVPHPKRDLLFIVEFTLAYLPVALVLMSSARINKLTAQTLKVSGDKPRDWPS